MKTARIPIRIGFYKEDGFWIAHCLEFSPLGHGKTKRSALSLLARAIDIQVRATLDSGNIANLFRPAEPKYFWMYANGSDIAAGALAVTVKKFDRLELAPSDYREFTDSDAEIGLV
jgi:hypothetical protein